MLSVRRAAWSGTPRTWSFPGRERDPQARRRRVRLPGFTRSGYGVAMKTFHATPLVLLLAACSQQPATPAATAADPAPPADAAALAPADAFLAAIASHCGQAYAGRIVANTPASGATPAAAPDPFEGKALVMHVRGCGEPERELRIPFHVGDDHSRTWVLTRTAEGLRLKHDHRHQDGTPDAVTMYGGDSPGAGSAGRQEFPVDAESVEMFRREGLDASVANTWAMEIEPDTRFLYELARPDGRLFQVEFDLSTPVAPPPPPWGDDKAG